MTIDFLCRAYVRNRSDETRTMITTTLDAMAAGGIHDQLAGGFARYSTDDTWLVPHFEKMLYDNALAPRRICTGTLVTGEDGTGVVVEDIVGYVLRDMRDPLRGFYSAEDADSEGSRASSTAGRSTRSGRSAATTPTRSSRITASPPTGTSSIRTHRIRGNILHVRERNAEPPVAESSVRSLDCSPAGRRGSGPASTTRCCSGGTR